MEDHEVHKRTYGGIGKKKGGLLEKIESNGVSFISISIQP